MCARKVKRKLYLLLEIDVGSVTMFGGGGCQEIQPSIGASPLSEAGGEGRGGGLGRSHDISCTPPRYGSELVAEFGSQLWNLRKRSKWLVAPELLPRAPIQPLNLCPSLVIPSTVWKFHLSLENVPLVTTAVKYPSEFRRITGFRWLWPFRGYTCIVNFHSLSHLRHGF